MSINSNSYINHINHLQQVVSQLEIQLTKQKLFMNMIIHDLRNPAESINQGLKQAI